ncbi:pyruvate kinase [Alloiococcus sp. CFN-8]|uniref:pyruvate kinase n=1 Tax=Alloiococcus sp. CFN-8 TaxID=3416081 RepID=UPI003CFA2037
MEVICSIGPNIKRKEDLAVLAQGGMTSARFNFAHIKEENYPYAREQMEFLKKNYPKVNIIQDLQGSKLRISNRFSKEFLASKGQEVYFSTEGYYISNRAIAEEFNIIPICSPHSKFTFNDVKAILIKDRTMEFSVLSCSEEGQVIKTQVKRGGIIRAEKGVNALGFKREQFNLSLKDKKDILFGLQNNVDVICMSYTNDPAIILELKGFIKQAKVYLKEAKQPKLWAKIECPEGVEKIKEIAKHCQGIMLGRGDLFAELPLLEIARCDNNVVEYMKKTQKPLIIATYVLDSMKNSPLPSLPEINEIYRYIEAKVGGFMLAGEVSTGKYPREALEFLVSMINRYNYNRNMP